MSPPWKRSQTAFVGVILANLASLAAIWWYGWQAHALLLVYWLETGVVGAIYVAKIRRAEGTDPAAIRSLTGIDGEPAESYVGKANREIADAFVSSYVGVWVGAGVILALLPLAEELALEPASPDVVALAAVSLVGYHLLSYRYEYVGDREYERRGPVSLAVEPAPRFWVLMLTIIFGLGAADLTRSPMGAIVVLAFFKTCAELVIHRRERKRAIAVASGSRETTV
ncbi:DUF6498-containing protein [Natrononativus amylolyticus]|uniref:DUF6498-containing protein n=1 Tax=Natrononativus amylolyticus TaxID=2963434 RepID=UPI0020CD8EE3|nr:DUF6498-containing protein [Natrononativus amylolyticus]